MCQLLKLTVNSRKRPWRNVSDIMHDRQESERVDQSLPRCKKKRVLAAMTLTLFVPGTQTTMPFYCMLQGQEKES